MQICRRFKLLICAGLLTSAGLSGCGGSDNNTKTIPSKVSIFNAHSVIFRNSTTFTTGYNAFGQLGDGALESRSVPYAVPGLHGMTKGGIGAAHTLVFGNATTVMAWGYNAYGQLGNASVSSTGNTAFSSVPVKVPLNGAIVTDIAAGGHHSLAVAGGVINAWGYNGNGQIGDGTVGNRTTPTPVLVGHDGETLGTAQLVAAGGTHSLAVINDGASSVYAWGSNASGQIGFSILSSSSLKPKKVASLPRNGGVVEQIAAMGRASLALEVVRSGGVITSQTLWGWGYNGSGELGKKKVDMPFTDVPVEVHSIAATDGQVIKKVAAGLNHVLLLMGPRDSDATNEVRAIGYNAYGQLGDNTTVNSFTLVQTYGTTAAPPMVGATDILAFGNHSFALVNGIWYGWGNNGLGQLGNPVPTNTVAYQQIPVRVGF